MQIPKDQIVSMIESRVGGDQAQQAAQQLPDQVDHEQHAGLLNQFGIDPQELAGQFGGGGGQTGAGGGQGDQFGNGGHGQGDQFGGQGDQFGAGGQGDQYGGGGQGEQSGGGQQEQSF